MKYFNLDELTRSNVALTKGILNNPPAEAVMNLKALVLHVLDPARERLGEPVRVTSGYRCRTLNALVGGIPYSQHVTGHAADITADHIEQLYTIIADTLVYDQLIYYRARHFLHVSYVSHRKNRKQIIIKS